MNDYSNEALAEMTRVRGGIPACDVMAGNERTSTPATRFEIGDAVIPVYSEQIARADDNPLYVCKVIPNNGYTAYVLDNGETITEQNLQPPGEGAQFPKTRQFVNVANIPDELKALPQWVVWQLEPKPDNPDKMTKVPYQANGGEVDHGDAKKAASNRPNEWVTFNQAVRFYRTNKWATGLGLMFANGLAGIDLDDKAQPVFDDTGKLRPWAADIVEQMASYTERSQSGNGLHILCFGTLPEGRRRDDSTGIEMYDEKSPRYFVMTGDVLPGYETIANRQEELAAIHRECFPDKAKPEPRQVNATPLSLDDTTLLDKARKAGNGTTFCALYDTGDLSTHNNDHSAADYALCLHLAWWTNGDVAQIDRLFRKSALMREKWERDDYRERTINKAVESTNGGYSGAPDDLPDLPSERATPATPHKTPPARDLCPTFGFKFLKERLERDEQGHAELLKSCFRNRVCYDHAEKSWFLWDGEKWQRDDTERFRVLAVNQLMAQYLSFVQNLYARAAKVTDEKERDDMLASAGAYAKKIRSLHKINITKNVLEWVQSQPYLGISGNEWDNCAGKLPCQNGIVDLATGEFRPMRPRNYILKMAQANWTGLDTPAPMWERFVDDIFNNDKELVRFVQRLLGYALLGTCTEQIFPIFHGSGANGKSTLCNVLEHVLGPLGGAAHKAIIEQAGRLSNPSSPQPFLVDLRGKRFAFVSETRKDIEVDAAQLKLITGNDFITARGLNKDPVTFAPTHTVFLLTNPKPRLDADDDALWRRVFLIPFLQVYKREIDLSNTNVKQANPNLARELQTESSGILAWLVRGSLEYRRVGLQPPKTVLDATKIYREENDTFSMWLDENCELDNDNKVKSGTAAKDYNAYCNEQGLDALPTSQFRTKMQAKFGKATHEKFGSFYYGVKVIFDDLPTDNG